MRNLRGALALGDARHHAACARARGRSRYPHQARRAGAPSVRERTLTDATDFALIHPRFLELRQALGLVDRRPLRALVDTARREQDEVFLCLAGMMRAAQRRERSRVIRILDASAALEQNAAVAYARVWTRVWVCGLWHARDAVGELLNRGHELPPAWAADVRWLGAQLDMMGRRSPAWQLDGSTAAAAVPIHHVARLRYVEVVVNGGVLAPFLLDTGAATTVVTPAFAQKIGLTSASAHAAACRRTVRDAGGRNIEVTPAVLTSIQLGACRALNVPVSVMALPPRLQVAGLLSPFDTFRELGIDVDLGHDRLQFVAPTRWHAWIAALDARPIAVRSLWNEGSLSLRVCAAGTPAYFLVDSGAGAVLMCDRFAEQLSGEFRGARELVTTVAAAGDLAVSAGPTIPLAVGRVPSEFVPTWIQPCAGHADRLFPRAADGYLGTPWLTAHRTLLAPDATRVTVLP